MKKKLLLLAAIPFTLASCDTTPTEGTSHMFVAPEDESHKVLYDLLSNQFNAMFEERAVNSTEQNFICSQLASTDTRITREEITAADSNIDAQIGISTSYSKECSGYLQDKGNDYRDFDKYSIYFDIQAANLQNIFFFQFESVSWNTKTETETEKDFTLSYNLKIFINQTKVKDQVRKKCEDGVISKGTYFDCEDLSLAARDETLRAFPATFKEIHKVKTIKRDSKWVISEYTVEERIPQSYKK